MTDLQAVLAAQFNLDTGTARMPRAVHRLDVPVSGCCLFARTGEALSFLSAAFARGECKKTYRAIAEKPEFPAGIPDEGELVHWIKKYAGNKSIACDEAGPGRKRAVLRYRVLGEGKRCFFMEIELVTGRHHQIRAQLARLGIHIKGDVKYGARRTEKGGGIRLHAVSLAFPDPLRGERILTVAPPPQMDALWSALPAFQSS
jgi:23S rRNA pseudouridine1911/1915/1917 synthase